MKNKNIHVTIAALFAGNALLSGCSTPPSPKYNIMDPIQAVMDYSNATRHYEFHQGTSKINWFTKLLSNKGDSYTFETPNWQQAFIVLDPAITPDDVESRYQLEDNLSRVCAAIRSDASLSMEAEALRGITTENKLNACISRELGADYPLFTFGWVSDLQVGDYINVIAPTGSYLNTEYQCKLKREGYSFRSTLYCEI